MDNRITNLDGNIKKQTEDLKKFLGLSSEQTFQELVVAEIEER